MCSDCDELIYCSECGCIVYEIENDYIIMDWRERFHYCILCIIEMEFERESTNIEYVEYITKKYKNKYADIEIDKDKNYAETDADNKRTI